MVIVHKDPVEKARRLLVPQTDKIQLEPHLFSQNLAMALAKLLEERSFHAPMLMKRTVMAVSSPRDKGETDKEPQQFLDKIGESYQDYRNQVLSNSVPIFDEALKVPEFRDHLPADITRPGAIPVIYMVKAHKEKSTTEEDDGLAGFIKEHPWLTAAVVIPGLLKLKSRFFNR